MLPVLTFFSLFLAVLGQVDSQTCGGPVNALDSPHQLSFWVQGGFRCSAALLSANHAITSAHCLNKLPVEWTWTLRAVDGQERVVGWWLIHSMNLQYDYDVVILTVTEDWDLSGGVKPVALPAQGELLDAGDVTEVTAWTADYAMLEKISMPILDFSICDAIYLPHLMTDRMYCAGRVNATEEPCQVNGGSPMINNGVLAGIFSFGNTGSSPDYPSSYTKIGEVRDWINAATGL